MTKSVKRLFYQTKIYDYKNAMEAVKHITAMEQKGWHAKKQADGEYISRNAQDDFPFTVEFFKEC